MSKAVLRRERFTTESTAPLLTRAPGPRKFGTLPREHRTIFISDTHLGTRGCKAELLADFLARNSRETLFLNGDIVDGWRLRWRWYWPSAHQKVVREILAKVDAGARVIYIPGNHDEAFRDFLREVGGRRRDRARSGS